MSFKKSSFLFKVLIIPFGLLISCQSGRDNDRKEEKSRPNILYIMADDLTIQAISAYEGLYRDIAPTPNIDRIAKNGMLFQDMICTNAICGPSRASILTGDYSSVNGYYKNEKGGRFDNSKWTFPQEFQKHDYETALFGKWHLGSEPKGFSKYIYHTSAGQQGVYWNPTYSFNGKDSTVQGYATNLTTKFALDWLKNEKKEGKPFLMLLQFKAPHRPWRPDSLNRNLWKDEEMPYPKTFNDKYKGRESTAGDTEMTMDFLTRRDMKMEPPENLSPEEELLWLYYGAKKGEIVNPDHLSYEEGRKWRYQTFIKEYLATVKSVDDNLGKILDYLDQNKLTENTIIVLTSDQGFYLGDHGFFDKRFIYEESLRMPFIVSYPGHVRPNTVNEDVVGNIDIAPTLLDLAHIPTEHRMQGRSFKPILEGHTPKDWRQSVYYHYYEWPFWHHVQPHYGIRTQRYTLAHFYYNIDQWELYDLEKDSLEVNNVINDEDYKKIAQDLKQQLKNLKEKFEPNGSLEDFRDITDKDFGNITKEEDDETSLNEVLHGKK